MVVTENGLMFLNSMNAESDLKKEKKNNKYYNVEKIIDCFKEVEHQHMVQIIPIMHKHANMWMLLWRTIILASS